MGSILPLGNSSDTYQGEREEKGAKNNNRESSEANNEKKERRERGYRASVSRFLCQYSFRCPFFPRVRGLEAECCCRTIYQTERERFSLDWLCVCFPLFFLFSSVLRRRKRSPSFTRISVDDTPRRTSIRSFRYLWTRTSLSFLWSSSLFFIYII